MGLDVVTVCYALAVAGGGILGYIKAGSTSSLLAGLGFGSVLGYGAYQTSLDGKNFLVSIIATFTLGVIMTYRFYYSGKFMPAGLIGCMSCLMMIRILYKHTLSL
ncbi:transmembrane protein 14C [Parasteatoda tepidariorum]|uniref:transmembrane protein 14C n=1 Tax=Parasteatoda tepidariorum TaxID=114398 RepID=UPI000A2C02C8|nr:transmembrane protein 14C [Parasteatoda tepidariorum]XP_021001670.1 transmembrane protein 14C [Parasteatoda tepidariorum]XP_021001671.1 transmembrane protein 14C [Parasteatoda tepidariorum]XP_021001672.1 transmembrane protein 14C [Parasteatoda tepidariorum]